MNQNKKPKLSWLAVRLQIVSQECFDRKDTIRKIK